MKVYNPLANNYSNKVAVSVVIPTFNRIQHLYPTLICLQNQRTEDVAYEIVIIDSGTDNTALMVSAMAKSRPGLIKYKRIRRCKNRSKLRTMGARLASGEILVFLDSDILVPPDFILTHYKRHQNRDGLVLLGKRRSLTEFDLYKIGEQTLAQNFEILEAMPFYEDVRDRYIENGDLSDVHNSWMFLFSHSFSMKKNAYFSCGGFNKAFGEQWGYEDIELGFRCFRKGFSFELESSIYSYHQPHFEQSLTEQKTILPNQDLFVRKDNYFEVELCVRFFQEFAVLYPGLFELYTKYRNTGPAMPVWGEKIKFDIILGCLFSAVSNESGKNAFLGVHIPVKSRKRNKRILILDLFFNFPEDIQISIILESFRLTDTVYFRNTEWFNSVKLHDICCVAGYEISIREEKRYYVVKILNTTKSKILAVYMPDVFSPQKRFLCVSVAKRLQRRGWRISFHDTRDARDFLNEDFCHLPKDCKLLGDYIRGSLDQRRSNSLGLLDMSFSGSLSFKNNSRTILLDDIEYEPIHEGQRLRGIERCIYLDKNKYDLLAFISMQDVYNGISPNRTTSFTEEADICCFMENGYLEDGIDLILEAFALCLKRMPDLTLCIKIPDYEMLFKKVHPLHNNVSRYLKTYSTRKKWNEDCRSLNEHINKLDIRSHVKVYDENMSAEDCLQIIGNTKMFVCATRTFCVPVEVYAAFILKKRVIIGEHLKIDTRLNPFCANVTARTVPFSEEFGLPVSSINVSRLAGRVDIQDLVSCMESSFHSPSQNPPEAILDELRAGAEQVYADLGI